MFVFAGDPLPNRRRAVVSGRNPAKRLAKALAVRAFEAFLRQAVRGADLIFAHDPAVARRFSREWSDRCHTFAVPPISDADLAGSVVLAHRQRRLHDAGRPVHLVTVADADPAAGLDHVLRAVGKARRLGANVILDVILTPGGPAAADLREQSGLGDALRPAEGAVADAFDAADLLVLAPLVPSGKTTSHTAAARGLPILTYRADPADAAVAEAGGARVVDRGEIDALASALLGIVRDADALAVMGESARGWAAGATRDGVHRGRAALVRAAAFA